MVDMNEIQNIIGRTVYDSDGEKIGKVAQVYLSNRDDQIEWLTVNTGLFGTRESFVPAHQATFGDEIRVGTTKDQIKNAPQIDADGELDGSEERELYNYYAIDYGDSGQADDAGRRDADRTGTAGHDTSGPNTDDAMTRSKEELQVGKQTSEAGRVRLRKYVTTEQQTVSVPVSHEEVRLEREPINDANRGEAVSGPDISEEEHEVILHKEEPVVGTTTTPVERVRLDTQEVTEQERVSGEVREEHIDVDKDGKTQIADDDRRGR